MSEQDPGDLVAQPVPVTRQNADRGENLDPPLAPVRAMLVFEATLTEPDSAAHFLGTGGPLGAAAAPWTTSFAVSGEDGDKDPATKTREPAVVVPLYQNQPTVVRIPLNPDGVQDPRDKLLIENNRQGAGINGTYGSFYAGGGAQLLAQILEQTKDGGATNISLTYAGRAQDGVITVTKARIEGSKVDMAYADPPRDVARTERAMGVIKVYLNRAWDRRTVQLPSVNEELAKLTKVLTKTNVGVHESCYSLVHDNLDVRYPFPLQSLEHLFAQTLHVDIGPAGNRFAPKEYKQIMKDALTGGIVAAQHASRVAMAVSQIVTYLMPYRSDGYGYLAPGMPTFVCAENWLRRHASPIHLNDCENGAKLAISIFETIRYDPAVWRGAYPHLQAVYEIIVPYYTWGLSIVGAGGAEAGSAGSMEDEEAKGMAECVTHQALNGHAIALLIPTAQLLTSLDEGARSYVRDKDGNAHIVESAANAAYATRFDGVFTQEFKERHESWYKNRLLLNSKQPTDEDQKTTDLLNDLKPLAIEGTTPASGYLCGLGAGLGTDEALRAGVKLDNCAEAAVGPTLGSCLKMLAFGDLENRFYQVLCEFHVPATCPLYADPRIRLADVAASQFIFSHKSVDGPEEGALLTHTGIPPIALVERKHYMVPLSTFTNQEADLADYGAKWARRDEMPRDALSKKGCAFALGPRENTLYTANVQRLFALNQYFRAAKNPKNLHPCMFMLPLAALVNNKHGVDEFCAQIERSAMYATVDMGEAAFEATGVMGIEDLMETDNPNRHAFFAKVVAYFELS